MLNMRRESCYSTGAADGVVAAGGGGAGRKVGVAQSSVAEKAARQRASVAKTAPSYFNAALCSA
jgi:hypothetical protein